MSAVKVVLLDPKTVIYLFNVAVAASLVCGVGLLASRVCRRRSAPVRHGILVGTLALVLMSPGAVWLGHHRGSAWMHVAVVEQPDLAGVPERVEVQPLPGPAALDAEQWSATESPRVPWHAGADAWPGELAPAAETSAHGAWNEEHSPIPPVGSQPSAVCSWQVLGTMLALAWMAGILVQVIRLVWGCRVLGRFRRCLEEVVEPRVQALARQAGEVVGKRAPPRIFRSPLAPAPLCFGFVRPAVVVPEEILRELDDGQLQAILIHEMAHLARHDTWVSLAQRIAIVLFWWNVLVYRLRGQIADLREDICDNYVCRVQRETSRFAQTLVEIAARATTPRVQPAALGIAEPAGLMGRVARLLNKERNMATRMSPVSRILVLTWTGVVLLAIVLVGGLRVAQSDATVAEGATPAGEKTAEASELRAPAGSAASSPAVVRPAVARPAVEPVRTLDGHTAAVQSVAFSSDGKTLASAGLDGQVRLWQMPEGKETTTLKPPSPATGVIAVHTIAFAPDGKLLASGGSDGLIRLWDPAAGKQVRSLPGHKGSLSCVVFRPDGKRLASAGADGSVRLWEAASGKPVPGAVLQHSGAVRGIAFGADGQTIVSTHGPLTIFEIDPPRHRAQINNWTEVRSLACAPNDQAMAIGFGYDHAISLWSQADDGELQRHILGGHFHGTNALAFSPDSKILASAGSDGRIKIWEVSTRRMLGETKADPSAALTVAFSPDGRQLASAGSDHKVRLWNVDQLKAVMQEKPRFPKVQEPPRPVQPGHAEEPRLVGELKRMGAVFLAKGARPSWSPDATRIVYVSVPDSELNILDLSTGQIRVLADSGRDPAWSPQLGRWIAYTSTPQVARYMGSFPPDKSFTDPPQGDEEIRLIDSAGGQPRKIVEGYAPAWSADGKTLYFVSAKDQKVKSVEVKADGSPGAIKDLFGITIRSLTAAISPTGQRVAYLHDGRLAVADRDGEKTRPTWPTRKLRDWLLGWSPDGKLLGGTNIWGFGGLLFLDQVTGRATRLGTGELVAPAWSPDGSMIAFNAHLVFGSEIWMIDAKVLAALSSSQPLHRPKGQAARFDVAAPFQPKGKLTYVDLQPKADQTMDLPTFDTPFNDMRPVPRGEQTLGGVKFTIGPGSLQLGSGLLPTAPERIEGIPVGKHVTRMYVLHGTQFSGPTHSVADGTAIGWYRVVYEDQTEQSIAIVAGEDVRHWFADDSKPTTRGTKVWEGKNLLAKWLNSSVRLFASGWKNPHPEKRVARIDYLAAGTQAAPFCLAITIEEPVSK